MDANEFNFDLDRTDFNSENDLKEYLFSLVLCYTKEMNKIEKYMDEKSANADQNNLNLFEEYRQLYNPIFTAFASDKTRAYGGKANSFGYPTKFDGIEEYIEKEIIFKTKSKAEVIFRTNNRFQAAYQFIIIRKNEKWRIDNAKYNWYHKDKWKPLIL